MEAIDLNYYTVTQGALFLEADNLLLLPTWTSDVHAMWVTSSALEAKRVAHLTSGQACKLTLTPIAHDSVATTHRGLPVAVQKQIISLRAQGLSYRKIAKLLNISKTTVGNVINR